MKSIAPNLYSFDGLMMGRVYLIEDPDGLTIIDGGIAQSTKAILDQITGSGRKLTDVKRILLTHAHPDHVGALPELQARSGGQMITSETEKPYTEGPTPAPVNPTMMRLMPTPTPKMTGITVDRTVNDGDVIPALGGLRVVATPGHSPGQIAFYQPERKIIILGDTLMHLFGGLRLPLPMFTADMDEAKRSIKKVAALDIEIACFGHGQPITENANGQIRAFAARL